jgi:ribose/xylose/arabinose/galactoside ABC-type transport system permease subunit
MTDEIEMFRSHPITMLLLFAVGFLLGVVVTAQITYVPLQAENTSYWYQREYYGLPLWELLTIITAVIIILSMLFTKVGRKVISR